MEAVEPDLQYLNKTFRKVMGRCKSPPLVRHFVRRILPTAANLALRHQNGAKANKDPLFNEFYYRPLSEVCVLSGRGSFAIACEAFRQMRMIMSVKKIKNCGTSQGFELIALSATYAQFRQERSTAKLNNRPGDVPYLPKLSRRNQIPKEKEDLEISLV